MTLNVPSWDVAHLNRNLEESKSQQGEPKTLVEAVRGLNIRNSVDKQSTKQDAQQRLRQRQEVWQVS